MTRFMSAAVASLIIFSGLPRVAAAGPVDEPGRRVVQPRSAEATLADAIESLALLDLRLRPSPGPDDYRAADALLSFASALDPSDVEIVRRRLEASFLFADMDGVMSRTREVVRLDPADSVAVLRLITMQVARLQTVHERLAAYDRFLGRAGEKLDASVRSRLALDASLLAREAGDEAGFVSRLTLATQLDSTNKEAAALAATYFSTRRPDDRLGSLEMAVNLLFADPVDPNVHFALAGEFAKNGAFEAAERFHRNARAIQARDPAFQNAEGVEIERIILLWQREGPRAAHDQMLRHLETMRYNQEVMIAGMEKTGVPTADAIPPDEVRLGLQTERLRMLAADAMGDRTAVAISIADYARSVERFVEILSDPTRRPASLTEAQAIDQIISMAMERLIIHAWTGVGVDDIITQLIGSPLTTGENADPVAMAWIALHRETPQAAAARFEALEGRHTLARVGLGLAREKGGDLQGAIELYRSLATEYPLSVAAAWARSRVLNLGLGDVAIMETTEPAAALAASVPAWVERFIEDPSTFMSLSATLDSKALGPTDPAMLTVSIRNVGPIPMAVGADRPINSRLLISPSLDFGASLDRTLTPEVLEADRRLRLRPGESLSIRTWGDPGFTGLLAQTMSSAASRGRFRVLQGFTVNRGVISSGAMCLSAETEQYLRMPSPGAGDSHDTIARRIRECPDADLPLVIAIVRALALGPAPRETEPESDGGGIAVGPVAASALDLGLINEALSDRYAAAGPKVKSLMLATIPHGRLAPALAGFDLSIRASFASETDPLVRALAIVTRTTDASDALLQATADDEPTALLIAVMRQRLSERDVRCYATASSLDQLMTSPSQEGVPDGYIPQANP